MSRRPTGLPPRYYTDPDIFAVEMDAIFARSWVMVGHQSQVAEPGQLLTARVGDESVIVANDKGTITGFYNVCQHRGHELVPLVEVGGDRASVKPVQGGLSCPYHAWSYNLDGSLFHARGEDVGSICIPSVRVENFAGFLFVNLAADAPSLEEWVPSMSSELLAIAPKTPHRVLSHRRSHRFEANWKVAVENYNECFHCPNVHKAFTSGVVSPGSFQLHCKGRCIHQTAVGPDPKKSGYTRTDEGNDYAAFFTWPTSSIQCYPGQVINTFRWVPLSVGETLLVREWWFDAPEVTEEQMEVIELDWETTVAEDFDIMDSVQRGMQSRGYTPGPLITDPSGIATVHSEDTIPHLHSLLHEALAGRV